MAVIAVDDPAVIDDDVATLVEALDGEQRPVIEAVLAVLGFAASRDANPVAGRQRNLHRPVHLEPVGKLRRRFDFFADNQARSFGEARCILDWNCTR